MSSPFELTMSSTVRELYNSSPLKVSLDEKVTSMRRLFRESKERVALVVDRYDKLEGIITRGDILIITSAKSTARVKDIMSEPIITVDPSERVSNVLPRMLKADEWYSPVVDQEKAIGIIGLEHIIQRMVDENFEYLDTIKVEEIMTKDVITASIDDYVNHVWNKMVEYKYAGLPVVDSKNRLVGIITQYDLLSKGVRINLESSRGYSRLERIREIMTYSVVYVYPWDSVGKVAQIMLERGFGRIPVISDADRRVLVGIVDREDIVRVLLR